MAPRMRVRALWLVPSLALVLAAAAWAALPQQSGTVDLLTQSEVRFDGAAAADVLGEIVAPAGDVNGDGLDDVIAATQAHGPAVIFGRGAGGAFSLAGTFGGFAITGGDFTGGSPVASAGDLNGDGLADVIVGTPAADRAWVVFGQAATTDVDLVSLGSAGFMLQGVAASSAGRWVASAPDMNGDGRRELIVGADGATYNARSGSGAAYVVFGKGDTGTVDLDNLGSGGFRIEGAQANHAAGSQVAGGPDVNGDGIGDVAVSASGADYSFASAGAVYVVFGKASSTSVDLADLDAGSGGFRIDGQRANDQIARSLAISPDMNGDGRAEVVVGADFADNPTAGDSSAGSAYVVFGRSSMTAVALASLGSGGFRIDGQDPNDQLARSLGPAGDVNGDGIPDIVVGALNAGNNGRTDSGSAYVVFGRSATTTIDTNSLGPSGIRVDGAEGSDFLGRGSNGAGDFNGDGRPDVVLGAEFADSNGANSGSVYVLSGFGTPSFAYPSTQLTAGVGTAIAPLTPADVKRTGAATFAVDPALPAGLALDPASGTISGTPTAPAAAAQHTVTMTDRAGSATAAVTIEVTAPASGPGPQPQPEPAATPCSVPRKGTRRADRLNGTSGSDLIHGGRGNDVINGRAGADCLFGDAGNDRVNGGAGTDKLTGGTGRDRLIGGRGKDGFSGGAGNDAIDSKDGVRETVNCGRGRDRVRADRRDRLRGCERRVRRL